LDKTVYPNYEVVLVDNASSDESVKFVRECYPLITVLENDRDMGFAGAVNRGIRYALDHGAQLIAVFSNDIKVRPDWINLVISRFYSQERIGVIGFHEVRRGRDSEELLQDPVLTSDSVVFQATKFASGPLAIYSAQALGTVGEFDEKYYLYSEENDLHARLRKCGYHVLVSNVPFWHYGEGYSERIPLKRSWLAYRNTIRYALKNEDLQGIIRTLGALANSGCNPFKGRWGTDRQRPYHPLVNFVLFMSACAWNVLHLRETLRLRAAADQIAKSAKVSHKDIEDVWSTK
jgi:GT2 family glycosyltransferase